MEDGVFISLWRCNVSVCNLFVCPCPVVTERIEGMTLKYANTRAGWSKWLRWKYTPALSIKQEASNAPSQMSPLYLAASEVLIQVLLERIKVTTFILNDTNVKAFYGLKLHWQTQVGIIFHISFSSCFVWIIERVLFYFILFHLHPVTQQQQQKLKWDTKRESGRAVGQSKSVSPYSVVTLSLNCSHQQWLMDTN